MKLLRLTEYSGYRLLVADVGVNVRFTECRRREAALGFGEGCLSWLDVIGEYGKGNASNDG